jgi:uncharacterized membrane protein YfcA
MPKLMREAEEPRENYALVAACGFPIGMVTGLTGVGKGVLIVPMLVLALISLCTLLWEHLRVQ